MGNKNDLTRSFSVAEQELLSRHIQIPYKILKFGFKPNSRIGRDIQSDSDEYEEAALWAFMSSVDKYDPNKGEFSTFSNRVIYNALISTYRKRLRIKQKFLSKDLDAFEYLPELIEEKSAEDHYIITEELEQMKKFVDSLSSTSRQIILLHFYQNLSYKDVATRVGMSPAGVGYRIRETLEQIRRLWQQKNN